MTKTQNYLSILICTFIFSCCINKKEDVPIKLSEREQLFINFFIDNNLDNSPENLLAIGRKALYMGYNIKGNIILKYALTKLDSITYEDYHSISVQNTKNGNYSIAKEMLDSALSLSSEIHGYYGWISLYYHRNYSKALYHLEEYDKLTPNFSDAPVGEDIHFLKGLCFMQLSEYGKAVEEFKLNIKEVEKSSGNDWINPYSYFYLGRCLHKMDKFEKAIGCYNNAIKLYESSSESYFYKALSYLELGEKEKAIINLEVAFALVSKGLKQSDPYVELFDEVYINQVKEELIKIKSDK